MYVMQYLTFFKRYKSTINPYNLFHPLHFMPPTQSRENIFPLNLSHPQTKPQPKQQQTTTATGKKKKEIKKYKKKQQNFLRLC